MNYDVSKVGMIWFERYSFPSYWGFCPDEKVWAKQMKLVGCPDEKYPDFEKDTQARVFEFFSSEHKHIVIITLSDCLGRDPIGIISLIAHEIEHVWQMMKNHMGEDNPGNEVEAYVKQDMLASMLYVYEHHRHKLTKKIKSK